MPQLLQGLGFDLSNTLARDRELFADFSERLFASLAYAEPESQDLGLAWRECGEETTRVLIAGALARRFEWRDRAVVAKEVPDDRTLVLFHRVLEAQRFLGQIVDLAHHGQRDVELLGQLLRSWLSAVLLNVLLAREKEFLGLLDHMDGNPN